MKMTTKTKIAGTYLAISLLAMTGEVNEKASMWTFLSYYLIGSANLYFASKLFSHLINQEQNGTKPSAIRNRFS